MQGSLADDSLAVHEGAVARAEIANAPRAAESLEHGVHARHPVGVHDYVVRLEGSNRDPVGVQRSQLPAAPGPHLEVAAHRQSEARTERVSSQPCRGNRLGPAGTRPAKKSLTKQVRPASIAYPNLL